MDDAVIIDAIAYLNNLFHGNSGGHEAAHSLRVYHNAMQIAERETGCDLTIVALAALLHDVDDYKLFNTVNNFNARFFLESKHFDSAEIESICQAINSVSFSKNRDRNPDTIEGMVVKDADRLDAIGAVGIARTFAYGGEHGRSMEMSIQHFYDKLLLLKSEMNTDSVRNIASSRHAFMELFLKEFQAETSALSVFQTSDRSREEKNHQLFMKQRALLEMFLEHGAISKEQFERSLHDLSDKMCEHQ